MRVDIICENLNLPLPYIILIIQPTWAELTKAALHSTICAYISIPSLCRRICNGQKAVMMAVGH